jgi:hypothetical protein
MPHLGWRQVAVEGRKGTPSSTHFCKAVQVSAAPSQQQPPLRHNKRANHATQKVSVKDRPGSGVKKQSSSAIGRTPSRKIGAEKTIAGKFRIRDPRLEGHSMEIPDQNSQPC